MFVSLFGREALHARKKRQENTTSHSDCGPAAYLCRSRGVRADFFSDIGIGARPMGMGNAYTGVADDLFSIFYNIAGLAQIGDNTMTVGYIWANPNVKARSDVDPNFHDEHEFPYHLVSPVIAFALDMDKMFARPLPIHTKFGMVNAIPDNFESVYYAWDPPQSTPRFYRMSDYWQMTTLVGGLSISTDYLPWVSVGIGFSFIISGNATSLPLPGGPGGGMLLSLTGANALVGANMAMDVNTLIVPNCGIMAYPIENLRMGYSYRGQYSLTVDPVIANAVVGVGQTPLLSLTVPLKMDVYFSPQQHNWGISYKWKNKVLTSIDVSWYRWSRYEAISRPATSPKWKDSVIPKVGVEYYPIPIVAVRAGYYYYPSPVPEQTQISNFLDNDRHVFSGGFGIALQDPFNLLLKPLDFNFVVQGTWMPKRTTIKDPSGGGTPESFYSEGHIITVAGDITVRF